jgi:hypothetical protein
MDEMRDTQPLRECRVRGRLRVQHQDGLGLDRATGTCRDALERRDAMRGGEVRPALGPGRRHDRDADGLTIGDERTSVRQERVEERFVAGLELATAVERDRAGRGHGVVTHRSVDRRVA